LLDTIRQYGQDKLQEFAEADAMRRRYRDWYARLAHEAELATQEAQHANVFDQVEAEHDNLRAALRWSLE
jgi:non-specific serine/threonine protein kinase